MVFVDCKHNAAYEMRISDWSSDVCSSDLPRQIEAARRLKAPVVELHTGLYAHLQDHARTAELKRLADAAALAAKNGIEVHAGHGLTYDNVQPVAAIPQIGRAHV